MHKKSARLKVITSYHPKSQTIKDDVLHQTIWQSFRHRIPWLTAGLFGGLLAAVVIDNFEKVISQNLILAAFIPLIVYMADAVGTQMESFVIRDLALNPKIIFSRYFFKHFLVTACIGFCISLVLFLASLIIYDNYQISLVLAISLFLAILTSLVTGLLIPYFFGKFRFDPADASGPIATIIQDILSVLVYFSIASFLLK